MSQTITVQTPLVDSLWQADGASRLARNLLLVLAGTALIAVAAKTQVPMFPVPMTMQTFAVLLIGMAYGWRLGGVTVLAYLAEGIMGLPVFAGPAAGPAYMMGPTAGYLVGFVGAAVVAGWLAERGWDSSFGKTLVANTVGTAIIFAAGFAWLSVFISGARDISLAEGAGLALASGVTPFLIGAVAKIVLAASVLPLARKLADRPR